MTHVNHNSPNFTDPRQLCPRCGQECLPSGVCHCGATPVAAPMPTVEELACMLATRIDSATPSELRQAAIMLDDKGNDFRTHRSLRPVYLRLSDVIKLVK